MTRLIQALTWSLALTFGATSAYPQTHGEGPAKGTAQPRQDSGKARPRSEPRDGQARDDSKAKKDDKKAKDDNDHSTRRPGARPPRPRPGHVVFIGGYFYDPMFGPSPWWPRKLYPHVWFPDFEGRAHVRILGAPKGAAVYVDGYYAGIVDDFDGVFEGLPVLPGGHTVAVYMPGYRTITRHIYLRSGTTWKLQGSLEPMPQGQPSEEPSVLEPVLPPPPGTYDTVRTPPQNQPFPQTPSSAPVRAAGFGTLSLRVLPHSARISIDDREWQTTTPGMLVIQLTAGRHSVHIDADRGRSFASDVEIREGETTELNVSVPNATR